MKIKEGFIIRKIANTDMAVPVGNNIADFNGIITLNYTAAFLWRILKDGAKKADLIELLMKYYDVTKEIAMKDTEMFIQQLGEANILDYDEDEVSR